MDMAPLVMGTETLTRPTELQVITKDKGVMGRVQVHIAKDRDLGISTSLKDLGERVVTVRGKTKVGTNRVVQAKATTARDREMGTTQSPARMHSKVQVVGDTTRARAKAGTGRMMARGRVAMATVALVKAPGVVITTRDLIGRGITRVQIEGDTTKARIEAVSTASQTTVTSIKAAVDLAGDMVKARLGVLSVRVLVAEVIIRDLMMMIRTREAQIEVGLTKGQTVVVTTRVCSEVA